MIREGRIRKEAASLVGLTLSPEWPPDARHEDAPDDLIAEDGEVKNVEMPRGLPTFLRETSAFSAFRSS